MTKAVRGAKVAFMDVTSATNKRTMVAALGPDMPFGNSVPILKSDESQLLLVGVLNSLAYDYATRARCGGLHLNYFVIAETTLPYRTLSQETIEVVVSRLAMPNHIFAPQWIDLSKRIASIQETSWYHLWALTEAERLRLRCMVDAITATSFGLELDDLIHILNGCDYPQSTVPDTVDPKGFWRIDKEKDPELRQTVLTVVACSDLKGFIEANGQDRDKGVEAFCRQNDGDGWMLPEALRLVDFGLGHDARAKEQQPVSERVGPRFYDWQGRYSVEESWSECERRARKIIGDEEFEKRMMGEGDENAGALDTLEEEAAQYPESGQGTLF